MAENVNSSPTAAFPPSISTVIFDYGHVICLPPTQEDWTRLCRAAGVSREEFHAAFWADRADFDAYLSPVEYWEQVGRRLGTAWDQARIQRIWSEGIAMWLSPDPEIVYLIERLRERGLRLALLSNMPHDLAGLLRHSPVLAPFESLFFSCDVGRVKPDSAFYAHALRELGIAPHEALFVDDKEENVLAAERLGIRAHRHTGEVEGLHRFLTEHVGPL